jgi:hypothetical protein
VGASSGRATKRTIRQTGSRHREFEGALAAGSDDALAAEQQRRRVALERQFDRLAGRRLAFPGEQITRGTVEMIAPPFRPSCRIAWPSADKPRAAAILPVPVLLSGRDQAFPTPAKSKSPLVRRPDLTRDTV